MLFLKSSIFLIFIIADIFHSIICKNISEADGTLVTEMIQALGYTILLPYNVSWDSGKKCIWQWELTQLHMDYVLDGSTFC